MLESVVFHLYIVSAIAALAFIVALVTAVFAARDSQASPPCGSRSAASRWDA